MEFWKEVAGLAANIVLLITAITAALGVVRWSNEHRGRKRIDLAEDLLACAYEVREAIKFLRGPFVWESESKDLVQGESEPDAAFRRRKTYSVAYFRYQQHADLFSKLRTICYRVEAAFGKPYGAPIRKLLLAPHKVINAGRSLATLNVDYAPSEEHRKRNWEFQQKLEGIFWEGASETDTMTADLDQALQSLEIFARHVIENEGAPGPIPAATPEV